MATFEKGDRIVNNNIRHSDYDQKGTVTNVLQGHFRGAGYQVNKDYGGTAVWHSDEVQALPTTSGGDAAPAKKKRFGIF